MFMFILLLKKKTILIQKQQKEQIRDKIKKMYELNKNVLYEYIATTDKLESWMEKVQNMQQKDFLNLQKGWVKWEAKEVAIFIGYTLKAKKAKITQLYQIAIEKQIN
ncbi:hypothetical protein RFI_21734 [Reticulomyxa filosa]|uniref:Uncharacterized protein n=1 Tax=Reticulomyxa filosa TaxID=46433 RepID=X6MPM7_RETFI|nr:hypothetical protein RFI_21734 [Reticulomyxa filosa]|eukprot:ETO15631.1 hypothetical protein RFI_21734 [Reticulomyxa filosa]